MPSTLMQDEIRTRLNGVQERLRKNDLEGALFVHKTDVYYLSATDQMAHLWVPAEGLPRLMVRKSIERAKKDSVIDSTVPLPELSSLPSVIQEHAGFLPKRIGLELDVLPVNRYRVYRRLFPGAEFSDISPIIKAVRMTKSPYEIACITKAADMGDCMFLEVPSILDHVETETELALHLESFYRNLGHPGIIRVRGFNVECFYGHVLAGRNAAVPSNSAGPTGGEGLGPFFSQGAGRGKILPHQPILIDYASNSEGYISDQTRIFSVGKLDTKFHQAQDVMRNVQDTLAEMGRPGARAADLYQAALEIVEKAGLGEGFMGVHHPVPFVGHGVGIELDEWPIIGFRSETRMKEGMVIALEPKFFFPGEGVVGIENVFVVGANGMERLNRFPDEIRVC